MIDLLLYNSTGSSGWDGNAGTWGHFTRRRTRHPDEFSAPQSAPFTWREALVSSCFRSRTRALSEAHRGDRRTWRRRGAPSLSTRRRRLAGAGAATRYGPRRG